MNSKPACARLRPTRIAAAICASFAVLGASGCRTLGNDSPGGAGDEPLTVSELGSMPNVSVCDGVWLGGCPRGDDLEIARRRGVRTVIDLRTAEERAAGFDAAQVTSELEMDYMAVGVDFGALSDEEVDFVLQVLDDPDNRPLLMFCSSGNRAATFFAIHRVVHDGLELDDAIAEARRAGMKPGRPERVVRDQVERLGAE